MEKEILWNVKYGELVVLGYNGSLPTARRRRMRSKIVIKRRSIPNGIICTSCQQSSGTAQASSQHTITYAYPNQEPIIMVCEPDDNKDMFQIGRSSESVNDFMVLDTIPDNKRVNKKVTRSSVSRFSCRIIADRMDPKNIRVFAGGFDSSKNIFLGEKTHKWKNEDELDGLPNNGILIWHPSGYFCGGGGSLGLWHEVSVGGRLLTVRPTRSSQQRGREIVNGTNILRDGTLIDLCGVTLLWRSAEGLKRSPTKQMIGRLVNALNYRRTLCHVDLNTLFIPRKTCELTHPEESKQPYVNINCGHVQGLDLSGREKSDEFCRCPICLKLGPVSKLCMGMEPAFFVEISPPTCVFIPCGHMVSEKTAKYWSNVPIPRGVNSFEAACPFCYTTLGTPGYITLNFRDNVD